MLYAGLITLPWWGHVVATLIFTHVTIVGVTIYLHRHQAHRALDLHPAVSHFFRFWLWLTTGMITREWVAVHRKHHAHCEGPHDPHSPQVLGIRSVLWGGVLLYMKEAENRDTIRRYGAATPSDLLERRVYSRYVRTGVVLFGLLLAALFGVVPGGLMFAAQMVWIPFFAAGVINGVGHYAGYRNWETSDASTNICPWGILIGGEELHNNHHAFPTSARLSRKWYECDIGWGYIRLLSLLRLARIKRA